MVDVDRKTLVALLAQFGWLHHDEDPTALELKEVIARYQDFHGLLVDEIPGPKTMATLEQRFCTVPDNARNAGQVSRWNKTNLSWYWEGGNLGKLSGNDLRQCMARIAAQVSLVVDLTFNEARSPQEADLLLTSGRIDGPGKVLGYNYLPDGSDRQLSGMLDTGEPQWVIAVNPAGDAMDAERVIFHETFGHGLGLDHGPNNCLMAPYVSNIRTLQQWDKTELLKRYREARQVPTPGNPVPKNPGEGLTIFIPGARLVSQ